MRCETRRQLNRYSQAESKECLQVGSRPERNWEGGGGSQLGFGWISDHAIISLAFGMQISGMCRAKVSKRHDDFVRLLQSVKFFEK